MRLRMADEDREKYGGPEWLDFADVPAWLDDLGFDALVDLEDQIRADLAPTKPAAADDPNLLWVISQLTDRTRESGKIRMVRIRLWLCLRAAGVDDLPLSQFRPARMWALKVEVGTPARDAVPPAGGSDSSPTSSPESDETTTTSTSASSTDASTPGPDEPTA